MTDFKTFGLREKEAGFTLLEIMIAMVLSLILLAGVYDVFITQEKSYKTQDQLAETLQNVRVGMDSLARNIRMAGYDYNANFPGGTRVFGFTDSSYNDNSSATSVATDREIYFTVDDDEDGAIDNNTDEKKGYRLVDDNGDGNFDTLEVDWLGAGWQPLAENITNLTFTYTYADGETSNVDPPGLPDNTDADTTNDFDQIRIVKIQITGRTSKEDTEFTAGFNLTGTAADGTCRARTLTALVKPRNLGL